MSRTTTIRVRKIRDDGYGITFGSDGSEQVLTVDDLRELQNQIGMALHFEPGTDMDAKRPTYDFRERW
jgi:hypothetical protein